VFVKHAGPTFRGVPIVVWLFSLTLRRSHGTVGLLPVTTDDACYLTASELCTNSN